MVRPLAEAGLLDRDLELVRASGRRDRVYHPAAAGGQTGTLYIGFAAAELLGLMAFAVAMIILYAR